MPTVGQITDKISELRSKIAIQEGLILHLTANFQSTDSGEPEMAFTRDDYVTVPEKHLHAFVLEARTWIDHLKAELEQWENLPVPLPGESPKPSKITRKARKNATLRRDQDHAASGEDGSDEAG